MHIRRYNLKAGIITMLGLYVDLGMKFFDAVPEIFLQTAICIEVVHVGPLTCMLRVNSHLILVSVQLVLTSISMTTYPIICQWNVGM